MPDPKGDKLFVNVSASAARRRLKGFGHGVRKVHSAGRDQAVIIHRATPRHLDELRALFADVGSSTVETSGSRPTVAATTVDSEQKSFERKDNP
jgi:DNA transformation protein